MAIAHRACGLGIALRTRRMAGAGCRRDRAGGARGASAAGAGVDRRSGPAGGGALRAGPRPQAGRRRRRSASAAAGPTLSLTLDEAVKMALDKNLDIAVQRLNPQMYDFSLASLKAVYLPTVSSLIGDQHQTAAPITLLTGGQQVTTTHRHGQRAADAEPAAGRRQPERHVEQQPGLHQQLLLQLQPGVQRDVERAVHAAAAPRPARRRGAAAARRHQSEPRDLGSAAAEHHHQHGDERPRTRTGTWSSPSNRSTSRRRRSISRISSSRKTKNASRRAR